MLVVKKNHTQDCANENVSFLFTEGNCKKCELFVWCVFKLNVVIKNSVNKSLPWEIGKTSLNGISWKKFLNSFMHFLAETNFTVLYRVSILCYKKDYIHG